jgi:hypothetical protein
MKRFVHLTALLALCVLATGTTAATAAGPDDRASHGPGAIAAQQASDAVRPDDRANHGPGAIAAQQASDAVRPDDRATHGPGSVTIQELAQTGQAAIAPDQTLVRADGFDWLDAAVGAAAMVGLGLIAGGALLVLRRGRVVAYS